MTKHEIVIMVDVSDLPSQHRDSLDAWRSNEGDWGTGSILPLYPDSALPEEVCPTRDYIFQEFHGARKVLLKFDF